VETASGSYKGALNPTSRPAGGLRLSGEGMRQRGLPVRAIAVVLALALVAAALAGLAVARSAVAQPVNEASGSGVTLTATSTFAFAPNSFEQVATNSTVTVSLTDAASVPHTFTIIGREGWVIPATISATDFSNLVFGTSPPVLFNLDVNTTGTVSGSFTAPAPGWYEFVCTEPGHFQEGMYGFIAFGMNLPGNLTVASGMPGPGAALFIIIGTIVSLVVIALVLGFVVGRRKGSMHEMPPERLGYPEPPSAEAPLPASPEEPRHS
jgi:uncharacterized cupredoxin-like copper-binding protein